ncbi:efflux RND transporter periplasmic adaptor subunit [Mesoterricola sediminis]|uniref:RND transporter n=1 Tax=Mesoterricola sediminis TaxID=2927980 RepID=A0AA48GUL4_9BACT|nr:efflux RND transporter periplasmic adaptor subunit [Mesoterricola sediminis]BDU77907.1 RND transporter [Mesoterricola sediminis]
MSSPSRFRTPLLMLLALGAGVGGTLLLRPAHHAEAPQEAPKKTSYQCPMHPQIIQDHAGDCPICGMALVPMDGGGGASAVDGMATVTIDPARQQLIGLTTAEVKEGPVGGELRTTARISADETRIRHIHVKVEGYVEKLHVDFVGMHVSKGQPLLAFYSPDFVSAQQEYLLALRTRKALAGGSLQGSGNDLLEAAHRRLTLWDVPAAELAELERTGEVRKTLTLRSPISGVVTAKTAVEGNRLTPADTPFEITDLGSVWALADVYEPELPRVKVGMPVELTLAAVPDRTFRGRVAFVDPQVDPKTRTTRVRVEVPNPGGLLKPEMFGEMVIQGKGRAGLVVPTDAVLDSGTRRIVFVALGQGRFEPKEVKTGAAMGDTVEILSGLMKGETVVTRANFLVDSESRLKAALAHMGDGKGK